MPSAKQRALFQAPLDFARNLDQLQRLALGHCLPVVGSLPILATDGAQEGDVLFRLDALCHDLLAELVREGDDRAQYD